MQFDPNDEGSDLFQPGNGYNAEVVEAEEKRSQKNNLYINLKLLVYADNGESYTFYDIIMPQYRKKFKAFCECSGLMGAYEAGLLEPHQCQGRTTRVRMSTERNEKGYLEIDTYLPPVNEPVSAATPNNKVQSKDDDIPF